MHLPCKRPELRGAPPPTMNRGVTARSTTFFGNAGRNLHPAQSAGLETLLPAYGCIVDSRRYCHLSATPPARHSPVDAGVPTLWQRRALSPSQYHPTASPAEQPNCLHWAPPVIPKCIVCWYRKRSAKRHRRTHRPLAGDEESVDEMKMYKIGPETYGISYKARRRERGNSYQIFQTVLIIINQYKKRNSPLLPNRYHEKNQSSKTAL